jgi:hypothetical protein
LSSRVLDETVPDAPASGLRLDDRLFIVLGLAWGAGLIHVEAAIEHIQEYALYALFFALLAPMQFGWGIAVYRRASRKLLVIGAALSLGVVALWTMSRTSGLPIGPEPWQPEAVGPNDVVATADEIVLALLVGLQLWPVGGRWGRWVGHVVSAIGVVLLMLSSLALLLIGGHSH